MNLLTIKHLKWSQGAGGAGWNKHVGKWLRRKSNKRLRNFMTKMIDVDNREMRY